MAGIAVLFAAFGLCSGLVLLTWPQVEEDAPPPVSSLSLEVERYQALWPQVEGDAPARIAEARAQIERRQDLEGAQGLLQQALVLQPSDAEALALLVELTGVSGGRFGPEPLLATKLVEGLAPGWTKDNAQAALALGAGDPVVAGRLHAPVPLDDPRALRLRMEIELALDNLDRALLHAEAVEALWPQDSGVCLVRASASVREGQLAGAEQQLQACVAVYPDPRLLTLLGDLADRTGRWEQALDLYKQAGEEPTAVLVELQETGVLRADALSRGGTRERLELAWLALAEDPEATLTLARGVPGNGPVRAAALLQLDRDGDALALLEGEGGLVAALLRGRAGGGWQDAFALDPANPHAWRQRLATDPDLEGASQALATLSPAEVLLRGPPPQRHHWELLAPASAEQALSRCPEELQPLARVLFGDDRVSEGSSEVLAAARLLAGDPNAALRLDPSGPVRGLALLAAGRSTEAHRLAVAGRDDPLWAAVLALATAARQNDGAALSLLTLALRGHPQWTALEVTRYQVGLRLLSAG